MARLILLAFALGAAVAAVGVCQERLAKQDMDLLQGTWVHQEGKSAKTTSKEPYKLTVSGNTFKMVSPDGKKTYLEGRFKIDAKKSPKQIDFTVNIRLKNDKGEDFATVPGETWGIYEVGPDTLKWTWGPMPRLKKFELGKDHTIAAYKRAK